MARSFRLVAACFAVVIVYSIGVFAAWDIRPASLKKTAGKMDARIGESLRSSTSTYVPGRIDTEGGIGYTEFDGFNNLNDPLYREGSKALLQKAMDDDKAFPAVRSSEAKPDAPVMRDAPADIPSSGNARAVPADKSDKGAYPILPVKKNRLIKMVPVDPVKAKSTL